ncbi:MAG: HEPN domain-containing protein [Candidatus Competibacterales bacterium]|nr:HEPN domain-containing protein [Candidatus Competibacterales bacterium]
MKDPEHARLMVAMAGEDLQAIRYMDDPEKFAESVFGFHCQQAVEKLVKAWLSMAGVSVPRTHDLRALFRLIEDLDAGQVERFIDLVDLTDYAVQFRYQTPLDLQPLDRSALVASIHALYRHVDGLLTAEP